MLRHNGTHVLVGHSSCEDPCHSSTCVRLRPTRPVALVCEVRMSWPVGRDLTPRERLLLGIDENPL